MKASLISLVPLAHALVEVTFNGLWQGGLLVGAMALAQRFWQTNATTRFVLWWATLGALLCLPLASWKFQAVERARAPFIQIEQEPAFELPEVIVYGRRPVAILATPERRIPQAVGHPVPPLITHYWPLAVVGLWFGSTGFRLVRIAVSYASLRGLCRHSRSLVDSEQALEHWHALVGPGRRARLHASAGIQVPSLVGLFEPIILVPERLVGVLSAAELEQIGLHELGHLRRWDDWTNLLQKVIEAVYFFHPAVLWIGGQLNLEREVACDDRVISLTGQVQPYALCLTRLLELTGNIGENVQSGALTVSRQVIRRIELLLDRRRNAVPRLARSGLFGLIGLLGSGFVLCGQFSPVIALPLEPPGPVELPEPSDPDLTSPTPVIPRKRPVAPGNRQPPRPVAPPHRVTRVLKATRSPKRAIAAQPVEAPIPERRPIVFVSSDRAERVPIVARSDGYVSEEAALESELQRTEAQIKQRVAEAIHRKDKALYRLERRLAELPTGHKPDSTPALGENELIPILVNSARMDQSPEVRQEAVSSLTHLDSSKGTEALIGLYDSGDNKLKRTILYALSTSNRTGAVEKLASITRTDSDPQMRRQAIRALARMSHRNSSGSPLIVDFPDDLQLPDIDIRVPNVTVRTPQMQMPSAPTSDP